MYVCMYVCTYVCIPAYSVPFHSVPVFSNARDVLSRILFQEIEDGETGTRLPRSLLLNPSRLQDHNEKLSENTSPEIVYDIFLAV